VSSPKRIDNDNRSYPLSPMFHCLTQLMSLSNLVQTYPYPSRKLCTVPN
jgi:hypothetical protein